MNEPQIITAKIIDRKELVDRNINPYLILTLDNDKTIYVFPSKVKENKWNRLVVDMTYDFTIEENDSYLHLTNFN